MTLPAPGAILLATLGALPLASLGARVGGEELGAASAASGAGMECCGKRGQAQVCVCAGCCAAEAREGLYDSGCAFIGDPCGSSKMESREMEVERVLAHLNTTEELLWSLTNWDTLQVRDFLHENGQEEVATRLAASATVMDGKKFAALMGQYNEVAATRGGFKSRADWSDLKVRLFSRLLGDKFSSEAAKSEADTSPCEMFGEENVCEGYAFYKQKGVVSTLFPEPSWNTAVYSFVCEATSFEEYKDLTMYVLRPDRDSPTALHLKKAVNFLVKEIHAYGTGVAILGKSMFHCSVCAFCKLWKKIKSSFRNLAKRFKAVWHLVKASDSMSTKQKVWRTFMQEIAGNDPLLMSQAGGGVQDKRMCQDFHGWQDVDGLRCEDYGAPCEEEERYFAVDGVSSWEACCVCGGGFRNFSSFQEVSLGQIESEAKMVSKALDEQDGLLSAMAEKLAARTSLQVKNQLVGGWFGSTREVELPERCKKLMDPKNPKELRKFHDAFRVTIGVVEPKITKVLMHAIQLEFISAVKTMAPSVSLSVSARSKDVGDCTVAPQKALEDAAASCSRAHMGVCMVVAKQVMYTDLIRQAWPPLGELGWLQRRRVLAELADTVSHSCVRKGGSEMAVASSYKDLSQEDLALNEAKEDCAFLAEHVRTLLTPNNGQDNGPEITDPHLPRAWYLALQQWSQSDSTKVVGDEVRVRSKETGTWHEDGIVIEEDKPEEKEEDKAAQAKVKVEYGAALGEPRVKWFSQDDPDLKQNNPAFSMLVGVPVVEPFTRALCCDILNCNASVARVSWHDIKETFDATFGVENGSAVRQLAVDEWTSNHENDEMFWPNQAGVGILRASRRLDSVFAARIKGFLSDNFRMSDLSPKALSLRSLPTRATLTEEDLDPQAVLESDNKKRIKLSMSGSNPLLKLFRPQKKERVEVWLSRDQQEQCPHIFHVPNCDKVCKRCVLREKSGSAKFSHVMRREIRSCRGKKDFQPCSECLRQQQGSLKGINSSSDFEMAYILNCPHRPAEEFYSSTHPVQSQHTQDLTFQAFYPGRAAESHPLQSMRFRFDATSDFALQRAREQWLQAIRESGRCWCACDTLRDFSEARMCHIAVDPRLQPEHPKSQLCLRGKHKDGAAVRCCRRDERVAFLLQGAGDSRVNGAYKKAGTHRSRYIFAKMKDPQIKIQYSESKKVWRVINDDAIFLGVNRPTLYYAPSSTFTVPRSGWRVHQGRWPPPSYDDGLGKSGAPTGNETCAVDNASIERAHALCQSRGMRLCSVKESRTEDEECPANNNRRVWTRFLYVNPKDYLQSAFKTGQFNDAVQRCLRKDDAVDT